jgi:hypothetical protein
MESETPIVSPLEDEMSTPQLAATTAAMWVGIQVPKEIDPGTSIIKPRSQSLCRRKSACKLQSFLFFVVFVDWASSHSEDNSKIFLGFLEFFARIFAYVYSIFLSFFFVSPLVSLAFFAFCERHQWQGVTQLVEGSST